MIFRRRTFEAREIDYSDGEFRERRLRAQTATRPVEIAARIVGAVAVASGLVETSQPEAQEEP